jgi:hypothetical protein
MHEVVHSNFHIRRLKSLRRPSFAGNGLPERMRSTAFAFLGLTAALGLALVAIFAQLSFPVLSPAPAPSGPLADGAVAEGRALEQDKSGSAPQVAPGIAAPSGPNASVAGNGTSPAEGGHRAAGAIGSPLPVTEPSPGGEAGDGGPAPAPSSPPPAPSAPSSQAPTAEADPPAATLPAANPNPKPSTSASKPKPDKKPAKTAKPAKSEKPEKSEKDTKKEATPPTAEAEPKPPPSAPPPPAPEDPPGKSNGNGKALGHHK